MQIIQKGDARMSFVCNKMLKIFILSFSLMLLNGCISLTTFQTPNVIRPNQSYIGFGMSGQLGYGYGYIKSAHFETSARRGIIKNLDAGFKLYTYGFWGDIKYQLISSPFYLSADIGASFVQGSNLDTYRRVWGLYPMIIMGTKKFYGGLKYIYINDTHFTSEYQYNYTTTPTFPVVFVASCIGDRFKIIPELSFFFVNKRYDITILSGWKIRTILGLGFQTRLGGD
jgi:hypothetical protein